MSLRDLIQNDASALFLNKNDFAADYTRQIAGDASNVHTVTGVFQRSGPTGHDATAPVHRTSGGESDEYNGVLFVAAAQATDPADSYVIDGATYQLVTVGETEEGLKPLYLIDVRRQNTVPRRSDVELL